MGEGGGETDREQGLEELLRVNAELAAEVRSLSLGRRDSPRSGQLPAARELAQLRSERDEAGEELRVVTAERDALQQHRAPLEAEVARLRGGLLGFLRRARARILRS
jgi:uncharacterized coiled-coil DUF342 family protein